jgi:hypothetical protein
MVAGTKMVKIRCAKLLSVLEAKLKRLGRLYLDGFISDEQYEPERDSLREQLSAATAPLPVTNMRAVSSGGLMETSSLPPFPQCSRSTMCAMIIQMFSVDWNWSFATLSQGLSQCTARVGGCRWQTP